MTLVPDSPLGLPMEQLYAKELNRLRARGRQIGELGALASHPQYHRGNRMLPFTIVKIAHTYAQHYLGLDDFVITVNPKHRLLYRYVFMHQSLGKRKHYQAVKRHPAVPLRLDLRTIATKHQRAFGRKPLHRNLYRFLHVDPSDCIRLPAARQAVTSWDAAHLRYFFEGKSKLWETLDPSTQALLLNYYPDYRPSTPKTSPPPTSGCGASRLTHHAYLKVSSSKTNVSS